jgi:hypothetical protein
MHREEERCIFRYPACFHGSFGLSRREQSYKQAGQFSNNRLKESVVSPD